MLRHDGVRISIPGQHTSANLRECKLSAVQYFLARAGLWKVSGDCRPSSDYDAAGRHQFHASAFARHILVSAVVQGWHIGGLLRFRCQHATISIATIVATAVVILVTAAIATFPAASIAASVPAAITTPVAAACAPALSTAIIAVSTIAIAVAITACVVRAFAVYFVALLVVPITVAASHPGAATVTVTIATPRTSDQSE